MIETERLRLRLFTDEDVERVVTFCNDFEVYKSTLSLPYPYTKECAEQWISLHKENFLSNKCFQFAITDKQTGELYGCIGLSYSKMHNNGELGYWVGRQYWGKGYATEAARAVIVFAFKEKGYHRVFARHFASNPASGKVMQKLGMIKEGIQKEALFKIDKYEDVVLYGILNL